MTIADRYELVRKIGSGTMGEVWAARHKTLDEEVAIKLVVRNVDHDDGTSAESRLLLEARVAAALSGSPVTSSPSPTTATTARSATWSWSCSPAGHAALASLAPAHSRSRRSRR